MAGRANPVLDVINSMSRPIEGMSAAARTGGMAGQSFEKGASLALKLDKLLGEEEARRQNAMIQSQQLVQNAVKMQIDANYRDSVLDLQTQQFNALEKQRGFTNALNLANAKDSNHWKQLSAAKEQRLVDNSQFDREYKTLQLDAKKTNVYDQSTGMFKKEYTPEYAQELELFRNKWGIGGNPSSNVMQGTTSVGPTVQNAASITPPPSLDVPNDGNMFDQRPVAASPVQSASQPAPAYSGPLPTSFDEANTLLGKAQANEISLNNEQRMMIREQFTKAGHGDAANIALRKMSEPAKAPAVLKQPVPEQVKMGKKTLANPDNTLKPVDVAGVTMDPLTNKEIPAVATYIVNGKKETIPSEIIINSKGFKAKSNDEAYTKVINPAAVVVNATYNDMFDSLKSYYDNTPEVGRKLFAKEAFKALARLRPDALMQPSIANDISTMFGDGLNKQVIRDVRTTIASYNGKNGKALADKVAGTLTKMVEYRGYDNKLAKSEEAIVDKAIATAVKYSFNPTILGNWLSGSANVNSRDIKDSDIKFDRGQLKADYSNKIISEYKTNGYSPTLVKLKSFDSVVQNSDTYTVSTYGNGRFTYNPAEVLKKDLIRRLGDEKKANKVMFKLFGATNTRYYSPDALRAREKSQTKNIAMYSKGYAKLVDNITQQMAVDSVHGNPGRTLTIDANGDKITIDIDTARKLVAWQFAAGVERNDDGFFQSL